MNYYELILTIVLGHIETLLKRTTFQKIKLGGVRRIYYIYRSASVLVFTNIRYFGEKKWPPKIGVHIAFICVNTTNFLPPSLF